jgi:crossover junction endodeoxyribonuclease RusA
MNLTLPFPPSANRYWRIFKGRAVKSAEARAYQVAVSQSTRGIERLEGDLSITLRFFRPAKRGDLDNRIKQILDALNEVAYHDDSQIIKIEAERFDDKKNPRVEVTIETYTRGD